MTEKIRKEIAKIAKEYRISADVDASIETLYMGIFWRACRDVKDSAIYNQYVTGYDMIIDAFDRGLKEIIADYEQSQAYDKANGGGSQ